LVSLEDARLTIYDDEREDIIIYVSAYEGKNKGKLWSN